MPFPLRIAVSIVTLVFFSAPALAAQTKPVASKSPQVTTQPAKSKSESAKSPQPPIPIYADFAPLLKGKSAAVSLADLDKIEAIFFASSGKSYIAKPTLITRTYAIMSSPVPDGEIAESVVMRRKDGAGAFVKVTLLGKTEVAYLKEDLGNLGTVPTDVRAEFIPSCTGCNVTVDKIDASFAVLFYSVPAGTLAPSQVFLTNTKTNIHRTAKVLLKNPDSAPPAAEEKKYDRAAVIKGTFTPLLNGKAELTDPQDLDKIKAVLLGPSGTQDARLTRLLPESAAIVYSGPQSVNSTMLWLQGK